MNVVADHYLNDRKPFLSPGLSAACREDAEDREAISLALIATLASFLFSRCMHVTRNNVFLEF